jgi:hypothetical protein
MVGLLDQLALEVGLSGGLVSLFLIHRASGGGVVYKSRLCETVVFSEPTAPSVPEDLSRDDEEQRLDSSDLCRQCRTFFHQLFATSGGELSEAAFVFASSSTVLDPNGEDSTEVEELVERKPQLTAAASGPEDPDTCEAKPGVQTLPIASMNLPVGGSTVKLKRKRRAAGKSAGADCSECGLVFPSLKAFQRHLRDWHVNEGDVDGDGGGGKVGSKPATVTKSCPYCTELFPVSGSA